MPFLEKKKVELVVKDDEADRIVRAIREAVCTGEIGDGKVFVSSEVARRSGCSGTPGQIR